MTRKYIFSAIAGNDEKKYYNNPLIGSISVVPRAFEGSVTTVPSSMTGVSATSIHELNTHILQKWLKNTILIIILKDVYKDFFPLEKD